jgi:hypothetical protein
MLFRDILNRKTVGIQTEFDRFLNETYKKQTHPGDLLLIHENGFYNAETHKWTNLPEKLSPYVIGPGKEGHSEQLHHKFIGKYIDRSIQERSYDEYLKLHEWTKEKAESIAKLAEEEAESVQLEMLIYLKIWEGDLFIKKFYQLARLKLGMEYDWHFSVAESSRDKKATGTRDEIIRKKIRNTFENSYPTIYKAFKNAYKSQIRNSIAHSKYSILGRYIHLNNYIEEDQYSQIQVVSFDEWADIFHDTLVLYTQQTRLLNLIRDFYSHMASQTELLMEVRVTRSDPEPRIEYHLLKHRKEWKDWYWEANDHIKAVG